MASHSLSRSYLQLQLLSIAKRNTVYRNAAADALQSELDEKYNKQRFPLTDQKNIETALVVSSRSRQLQDTMQLGLQPRQLGHPLPGDPESEGDDAVCCVCFCPRSVRVVVGYISIPQQQLRVLVSHWSFGSALPTSDSTIA